MKDVFDKIEFEDLTEDLLMLANACGIEATRNMLRHFGGINFYIPKLSRLDGFICKYMCDNKDKTYKQIATELSVSEHYLRILRKRMADIRKNGTK